MATKKCTVFCDIDGTLFKYRKFADYKNTNPVIISTTVSCINESYENGQYIVLTTARPEYLRTHTMKELDETNIKYHQLVMGIERGSRILINDKEDEKDRAYAFNVSRNTGMTNTQCDEFVKILQK